MATNDIYNDGNAPINGQQEGVTLNKILGATNLLTAGGGATWGSITGTLSNQTDLQAALDAKQGVAWTSVTGAGTDVNGAKVAANTTASAFTRTLPASPSVGDNVTYMDAGLTFDTNNLTIARNGELLNGGTSNFTGNVEGAVITCVFVGGSIGWSVIVS